MTVAARPAASTTEVPPAISVGVLLLFSGIVLLAAGDAILPSDPGSRSLWTALVGMIVVLGGIVYLLARSPRPAPAPASPPALASAPEVGPTPRVADSAAAGTVDGPTPADSPSPLGVAPSLRPVPSLSAQRAVARAAAVGANPPDAGAEPRALPESPAVPSSIPGAYLQAIAAHRGGAEAWSEIAPPIAAALPFSPGIRRSSDPAPWDESSDAAEREAPRLELELARLRARVRELETPVRPVAPAVSVPRAGASYSPKEPPTPPALAARGPRGCVGCGTGLAAAGPSHLCWGCGRPMCSTCYWRYGPGPGLHRCPDCYARSPGDAISGARLTAGSTGLGRGPPGPPTR